MKQTAVEWLIKKREKEGSLCFSDFCKAKEMEKQQIINAYKDSTCQFSVDSKIDYPKSAEQYYNETFNK
jgi:hypothetical protein